MPTVANDAQRRRLSTVHVEKAEESSPKAGKGEGQDSEAWSDGDVGVGHRVGRKDRDNSKGTKPRWLTKTRELR